MPALDRFILLIFERQATALTLHTDHPIQLELNGTPRPVTKEALTSPKLLALVREIMPQAMRHLLEAGDGHVAFDYTTNDKHVDVAVDRAERVITARVTPFRPRRSTAAMSTPAEALLMPRPSHGARAAPAASAAAPASSAPAEALVQAEERIQELLRYLVSSKGSDLHLRVGLAPVYRTHGEIAPRAGLPALTREDIEGMLMSIMPDRNKAEYAETNDTDFAYEILGVARFRVNALRDRMGPAAVFRVIPTEILTADQLGLSAEVQKLCFLTKGLVVVTGPTGSGKSTTLSAMVDLINRNRTDHIITIEDPIEFVHPNKKCVITQRQVGSHTQSFKRALRAALREDPDIILIGEMRDLETVAIAIETAETGHLVFGTLHTTTAVSTVDRIIDQFPADRQEQIRIMLSESLKGVIAQVLCKKIQGGRVAAREVLLSIPAVANLIREGKTFQLPSIIQTNKKLGMIQLNDSLIEHVEKKVITPEEGYLKSVDKQGIEMALKSRNIKLSLQDTGV